MWLLPGRQGPGRGHPEIPWGPQHCAQAPWKQETVLVGVTPTWRNARGTAPEDAQLYTHVCVHAYTHLDTALHLQAHLHAYAHNHAYTQTHASINTHVHTCVYIHMCTHLYSQSRLHTHTRVHRCAKIYTYTHIHTYIHVYTRAPIDTLNTNVHMCAHAHIHMFAHRDIRVYTIIPKNTQAYLGTHLYTHIYPHTCTCTHAHVHMSAPAHIHTCTCAYKTEACTPSPQECKPTHVCTHRHVHTHTLARMLHIPTATCTDPYKRLRVHTGDTHACMSHMCTYVYAYACFLQQTGPPTDTHTI